MGTETQNIIMWHVDPLLGNEREVAIQQPLLSNGRNRHVRSSGRDGGSGVLC
jgi:hypothetical protein